MNVETTLSQENLTEIEDKTRTTTVKVYTALLSVDKILNSAKKIASGNLFPEKLRTEIVSIGSEIAKTVGDINDDSKAGLIASIGLTSVSLLTDILNGNDLIDGGKGDDCIFGGVGNDSLWGGAGR